MSSAYKKPLNFINRHPIRLLSIGMLIYIAVFTYISFWKYDNFLYNALDLGIYAQVFESFGSGNYWYSSIQQSSYLGDHFEPFILALLPFYLLIPHPKTLLVLQTIFLALPAIPIFFIARTIFQQATSYKLPATSLSLGIAFFYLLNPLVHNINLFEFHLLPFSLVFLFCATYFYIKANYSPQTTRHKLHYFWFLLFCFLALLIREDISLIIFMFGVLALIERRRWYWVIAPMLMGAWWFLLSMKIISAFNIEGGYKFLTYYSWIFQVNPLQFIAHFVGKIDNWEMIFGLLLAFLFLPLFKTRFLILALPPFLQFALVNGGSGGTVFTTHYAAYFLPALFLAGIFGVKQLADYMRIDYFKNKAYGFVFKDRGLLITIFSMAMIGLIIFFGPLGNFIPYFSIDKKRMVSNEETRIQKALVNIIPIESDAMLSSAYLPERSASQNDSALFWTFKGFKQFSSSPYIPPYSTGYALIDSEDLSGFIFSLKEYENGDDRIRNFIKERKLFVQDYADRFILFSKKPTQESLYEILDSLPEGPDLVKDGQSADKNGQVKLTAHNELKFSQTTGSSLNQFSILSFSLFWEKMENTDKIYAINILARAENEKIALNKIYPLGYGLYPASDWEIGKIIQTNQHTLLPGSLKGEYKIYLRLIDATDGGFVLDQMRSDTVLIPDKSASGEVFLGAITLPHK